MMEVGGSSEKLKREMLDIMEKVKALRLNPTGTRVESINIPSEKTYEEPKPVPEVQPVGAFESEAPKISGLAQTISTVAVKSTIEAKTDSSESKKAELLEQILVSEEKTAPLSKEAGITFPPIPVEFEVFYKKEFELDPKIVERLEKIWDSLVPRDTICPYCRKPVLSIDRVCYHCGAVNI